jgi:hypothetical protein
MKKLKNKENVSDNAEKELRISGVMVSLLSIGIENIKISDEVRWFYQIDKWSKPIDEIVYIGSEPVGGRIRIDRMKNGKLVEGGYVNLDELYLTN